MAAYPAGTLQDRSGTITTGAASQVAAAANVGRQYLLIQNLDTTEDLWVNFGAAAAITTPGSIRVPKAGGTEPSFLLFDGSAAVPTASVNVNATTLGHK